MKLRLRVETVEVPDDVGEALLAWQQERDESDYWADTNVSHRVYLDQWSYEVLVPSRWERV